MHLDGFITKKNPIYRVAQKKYTHCTLILMSKECIHFLGPLCILAAEKSGFVKYADFFVEVLSWVLF
jgi:hypothetical protein